MGQRGSSDVGSVGREGTRVEGDKGKYPRGKEAAIVSGRGVISIGLEKKYGLRPSCLLYSRGGRGKESIPREGGREGWREGGREGYRRVREAQKVSFSGPVMQLACM